MHAIRKAISKEELSRHCRRRTRGAEVTLQLIEELLLQLSTATDSLGVPVLSAHMVTIWEEEKKHLKVYSGSFNGGTVYSHRIYYQGWDRIASVQMCTRDRLLGIISPPPSKVGIYVSVDKWMQSFLARFIPGSSASDVHYQGFMLEGLSRWNQARILAASQQQDCQLRSFNLQLACKVN